MEKGTFRTLIKAEGRLTNEFVIGKISGIMLALCDKTTEHEKNCVYAIVGIDEGYILTVDCYEEDYAKFKCLVETHYPGLCVFNY